MLFSLLFVADRCKRIIKASIFAVCFWTELLTPESLLRRLNLIVKYILQSVKMRSTLADAKFPSLSRECVYTRARAYGRGGEGGSRCQAVVVNSHLSGCIKRISFTRCITETLTAPLT